MKSLSKGNSSKKDPVSSSSILRDSTTLPSSSVLSRENSLEDEINYVSTDKNRFGWSKQPEREPSPPVCMDRVPSGRTGGIFTASVYSDSQRGQRGGQDDEAENEVDYLKPTYEQDRRRKTSKKVDTSRSASVEDKKIDSHVKYMDLSKANNKNNPDDDLNTLLKVIHILFWACFDNVSHN